MPSSDTSFAQNRRQTRIKFEVYKWTGATVVDPDTVTWKVFGWIDYSAYVMAWSMTSRLTQKIYGRRQNNFDIHLKIDTPPPELFQPNTQLKITIVVSEDDWATEYEDGRFFCATDRRTTVSERDLTVYATDALAAYESAFPVLYKDLNEYQLSTWVETEVEAYKLIGKPNLYVDGIPTNLYPIRYPTLAQESGSGLFTMIDNAMAAYLGVMRFDYLESIQYNPYGQVIGKSWLRRVYITSTIDMLAGFVAEDALVSLDHILLKTGYESQSVRSGYYYNTVKIKGKGIIVPATPALNVAVQGVEVKPNKKVFYKPTMNGLIPVTVSNTGTQLTLRQADDDISTLVTSGYSYTFSSVPGAGGVDEILIVITNNNPYSIFLRKVLDSGSYLLNTGDIVSTRTNSTLYGQDGGTKEIVIESPLIQSQAQADELALVALFANDGYYQFTALAQPQVQAGSYLNFKLKDGTNAYGLVIEADHKYSKEGYKMKLVVRKVPASALNGWFSWDVTFLGWDEANWLV